MDLNRAAGRIEPQSPSQTSPRRGTQVKVEDLLGAFEGKIKRVHTSIFYKLGLLLVAVVMLALVLIYLAMIAAVVYGVYRFAVGNLGLLTHNYNSGRLMLGRLVAYLTPILSGLAVIVFMIKPLLARHGHSVPPRALKLEDEPLLYAFIQKVCETVRAPVPQRIQVDFEVNASAGPHRGVLSILMRDLTLTIGLPLAAGLNLRQLTGVLAHEFGHFSQGGGMVLTYLIRQTNRWFARVVYERDGWDAALEAWSARGDLRVRVIFIVVRLLVWLTRRVLWVLMHIGHTISCFMSRQMEFDADRYEARLAGSEAFEGTALRILLLSLAEQKARNDLAGAQEEKRLGDDLPALIAANLELIPPNVKEQFLDSTLKRKARLFDTHPGDLKRIESARRENAPGVFRDERPASVLFSDFGKLCQEVSMDFYSLALGRELVHSKLVPTPELLARQQDMQEAYQALSRFFHDVLLPDRPLGFSGVQLAPPLNPRDVALELKKSREHFALACMGSTRARKLMEEAQLGELKASIAGSLLEFGIRVKAKELGLQRVRPAEIAGRIEQVRTLRNSAEMRLAPLEDALRRRLVSALELLYTPQVEQRLPGASKALDQAEHLVMALQMVESVLDAIKDVRRAHLLLNTVVAKLQTRKSVNQETFQKVKKMARDLGRQIDAIHIRLKMTPYPFSHANGSVSLGHYVLDKPVNPDDISDVLAKASELLDRIFKFNYRALGSLALIAEQVEQALGLPPIEKPAESEEAQAAAAEADEY